MNAKFIVSNEATLITFGGLNAVTITFVIGLFITSLLVVKKMKAALILGVVMTTLLAIPIGRLYGDASALYGAQTVVNWQGLMAAPDFSLLFKLDLLGSLSLSLLPVIFAFTFTDMFDSLSTFVGV